MRKNWTLYALHILDCISKIDTIMQRGDITTDAVLYDWSESRKLNTKLLSNFK